MQKIIGVLQYECIKCGEQVRKGVMPAHEHGHSKAYISMLTGMFDEKLCLSCLTGTNKRISGAAENLEGLLC